LVWDGKRFPFHEVYDIRFCHPKQAWSFFVRYALHVPSGKRQEAFVSLTGFFADQKGQNIKLEQRFPLLEHDVVHADRFITVGAASFSLAEAIGCVEQNDQALRWEIFFEDPTQSRHLYPRPFFVLPFPKWKFLAPRFQGFVSGQLFINHHSRDFQQLKVFQSHRYGVEDATPFSWVQCSDFEEDEGAVFEGLVIERGWPRSSRKRWGFFRLVYDGQEYTACQLWKKAQGTFLCGDEDPVTRFEKKGLRFDCCVAPTTKQRGLSLLAAIQIKIYKKHKGSWTELGVLTSKIGGVVEEYL
jgi:hypothetical protein